MLIGLLLINILASGLSHIPRSFIFSAFSVLVYVILLVSLGTLIFTRLWQRKNISLHFIGLHLGFWLIAWALGMEEYDRKEYQMSVMVDRTEWRGHDLKGALIELPIAVRLLNIEEKETIYAHIIAFTKIGREKEEIISVNNPLYLSGWRIYVESYGKMAELCQVDFRIVYNPWHYLFHIGLGLLGIGCIVILFKRKKYELE